MSLTVLWPPGLSPPPLPPAVLAQVKASLEALAARLGQTLPALVTGTDAHGLTQLKAGELVLTLRLSQPLPADTPVQVVVRPNPAGLPTVVVQPAAAPVPQAAMAVQAASVLPLPSQPAPATPPAVAASPTAPAPLPPAAAAMTMQPAGSVAPANAQPVAPAAVPTAPAIRLAIPPSPPAAAAAPSAANRVAPAPAPPAAPGTPPSPAQPAMVTPPPASATSTAPVQPATGMSTPPAGTGFAPPPAAAVPAGATAVPLPGGPVAPAAGLATSVVAPTNAPPSIAAGAIVTAAPAASAIPTAPSGTVLPAATAPSIAAPTSATPSPSLPATAPSGAAPAAAAPAAPAAPAPTEPATRPLAVVLGQPAQAAARQDSMAPLLQNLSALQARLATFPPPVAEAAMRLLANRLPLDRGAPGAEALRQAVARAGVVTEAGRPAPPGDVKAALLQLRQGLLGLIDGEVPAVTPVVRRPPPPLRDTQPRAIRAEAPSLPEGASPREAARPLLSQTESALARLKLTQLASSPDAARTGAGAAAAASTDFVVELPLLLGQELSLAQLRVQRDGSGKSQAGARGWRVRFAVSFAAIGEVGAQVSLLGGTTNVMLWAEDNATADALEEMLPELAPLLGARGLNVGSVRLRRGLPAADAPEAGRLMDRLG